MYIELLIVLLFLVLILSTLFTIKPPTLKKISFKFQKKHDQTSLINLTLWVNFRITLGLMKSNCHVALLYMLYINLQQCYDLRKWVDIKCKKLKLMWKTFGNVFFSQASRRKSFLYFSNTALDHGGMGGGGGGGPLILFIIFLNVTIFSSSPTQYLKWSAICEKNGNS